MLYYVIKENNCVVTFPICYFYFRVTDITINRVCKFWLWNKSIFNLSQNGRDFNKSLKILHTFTENVSKNLNNTYIIINKLCFCIPTYIFLILGD